MLACRLLELVPRVQIYVAPALKCGASERQLAAWSSIARVRVRVRIRVRVRVRARVRVRVKVRVRVRVGVGVRAS